MPSVIVNKSSIERIADAIRLQNRTATLLTFPEDFVYAISDISTQDTARKILSGTVENYSDEELTYLRSYALYGRSYIGSLYAPNCLSIGAYALTGCTSLRSLVLGVETLNMVGDISDGYAQISPEFAGLTDINATLPNCSDIAVAYSNLGNDFYYSQNYLPVMSTGSTIFAGLTIPNVSVLNSIALIGQKNLSYLSAENCEILRRGALYSCSSLLSISLPACTFIEADGIGGYPIQELYLPNLSAVSYAISGDSRNYYSVYNGVSMTSGANVTLGFPYATWNTTGMIQRYASDPTLAWISGSINNCYLPSASYLIVGLNSTLNGVRFFYSQTINNLYLPICEYMRPPISIDGGHIVYLSSAQIPVSNIYAEQCVSVHESTFYQNQKLQYFYAPNCQSIGNNAFYSCVNLSSVDITNCQYIGNSAFARAGIAGDIALSTLTHLGSAAFSDVHILTASLPSCTYIGSNAFAGCSMLREVYAPNCSEINAGVFTRCSSLTTVNLGTVEQLIGNVFQSCTALSDLNFEKCTLISGNVFVDCTSLQYAEFPNCSFVEGAAFGDCTQLQRLSLPVCASISSGNIVTGCINLSEIYLPECASFSSYYPPIPESTNCSEIHITMGTPNFGSYSPRSALSLNKVTLTLNKCITASIDYYNEPPGFVTKFELPVCTSLASSCFYNYVNLREIYAPEITSIGTETFRSAGIESCVVPKCEYIGSTAFMWCNNLRSISFPNLVAIDTQAFFGCSNLSIFGEMPKLSTIGTYAFGQCSFSEVDLPATLTKIYELAFAYNYDLEKVTLRSPWVVDIGSTPGYQFNYTKMSTTGSFYVPASLVSAYKADSMWGSYKTHIYPIT